MYFIVSQLFSFTSTGLLVNSHESEVCLWVGVAKFETTADITKKQLSFYQHQMVRKLLDKMLKKLGMVDKLESQHYPYRLKNSQYYVCFSHSRHWVTCAIHRSIPVGIDLEKNTIENHIAQRFFHSNDLKKLFSLPPTQQSLYKQLCWMLAESLLKKHNGKQLGNFLKQDYSLIIPQLMKITLEPKLNNTPQPLDLSIYPINRTPPSPYLKNKINIIYLAYLSVVVVY